MSKKIYKTPSSMFNSEQDIEIVARREMLKLKFKKFSIPSMAQITDTSGDMHQVVSE